MGKLKDIDRTDESILQDKARLLYQEKYIVELKLNHKQQTNALLKTIEELNNSFCICVRAFLKTFKK